MAMICTGLLTASVGFSAASLISVKAINQIAYATAKCGDLKENLRFATESRVALFTWENMTPSIVLSSLVAGVIAYLFVPEKTSEGSPSLDEVIEILKHLKN